MSPLSCRPLLCLSPATFTVNCLVPPQTLYTPDVYTGIRPSYTCNIHWVSVVLSSWVTSLRLSLVFSFYSLVTDSLNMIFFPITKSLRIIHDRWTSTWGSTVLVLVVLTRTRSHTRNNTACPILAFDALVTSGIGKFRLLFISATNSDFGMNFNVEHCVLFQCGILCKSNL
jgi:hypothetical protein